MTITPILQVHVDTHLCEGHGLCLQLAPEVFDLDDDEIASCAEHPEPQYFDVVRAAAAACPRQAVVLQEPQRTSSLAKD
jgi:ferredoxin